MKKIIKISLVLNIAIFILVLVATLLTVFDVRFMGEGILLERSSVFEPLKFFTVDSNILMGVVALIFAIYEIEYLKGKRKEIPESLYILKHIATVGVVLTFVTTAFYLAPFSGYDFFRFFKNSNLFFHLIVPILSLITYTIFEKHNYKKKVALLGTITMFLYSIFYTTNYFLHFTPQDKFNYDWYGFVGGGLIKALCSITIMYLSTFVISYVLYYLNKKNK